MSDFEEFVSAFQRGQAAAETAQSAKTEIDTVLSGLSMQISAVTEGKIEIAITESSGAMDFFALGKGLSGSLGVPRPDDSNKSKWIAARNPKQTNSTWVSLAKWVRPYTGYPCTILYNDKEVRCHDREALERGLSAMLADAWVGEKLHSLLTGEPSS